jgi:hypothetical protein
MNRKILTIGVIILLSFLSCDKYHRNRYVGEWDFVTERIYYNLDSNEPYSNPSIEMKRETTLYLGKITLGNHEGSIHIQYSDNNKIGVGIEEYEGNAGKSVLLYHKSGCGSMLGKYSCGKFESKDKMNINLCWGVYPSLEEPHDMGTYDIIQENIVSTKKKGDKK